MAISPSNSGFLRAVGDAVKLERDPKYDAVGVQVHGDAEGVELVFEGALPGGRMMPLETEATVTDMPAQPDGRFAYIMAALHCRHVQVRLAAIAGGSVHVALISGEAVAMKPLSGPPPMVKAKPAKLERRVPKENAPAPIQDSKEKPAASTTAAPTHKKPDAHEKAPAN